jgi:hypothetical protein
MPIFTTLVVAIRSSVKLIENSLVKMARFEFEVICVKIEFTLKKKTKNILIIMNNIAFQQS